ncbi:MAG: VCBS repeat-containing protein [Planctomycetes bacterium]|nr:VCBS repeat-containing protein [Planctomycetota bacterium]
MSILSPRRCAASGALLVLLASAAAEEAGPPCLAEKDTRYLQDAEHLGGFVLGDLAFPLLKKALVDRNVEELKAFLDPTFQGRTFDPQGGALTEYPFAAFRVWREGKDPVRPRDRDAFVAELLAFRDELQDVRTAGVKVIRMSPATYGDLAGPWAGSMKVFLGGRTRDGKVSYRSVQYRCRVKEITDETPNRRGWLLGCESYLAEYSSSGDFLMQDMTAETRIDSKALHDNWVHGDPKNMPFLTGGAYMTDYDQDGHMDVLVTDLKGLTLYKGLGGGRFADVTESSGLPRQSRVLGGIFADLDSDGYEDLLLGAQPYVNEAGKRFRPLRPAEHTLRLDPSAFKYAVADYDRDGKLDLYVVGIRYRDASSSIRRWIGKNRISYNQLWRNLGGWKFQNATQKSGTGGSGSSVFAAVWFDANGDDWPDVMTANELGTNDYYLNRKDGTFVTGQLPAGYGGFSMGITVSDIDNDGLGDPYVANMYSKAGERVVHNLKPDLYPREVYDLMVDFVTGNELYRNRGDGRFERIGQSAGINDVGWAFGTGFGDLDSNGLPDLYSPVGFQSITRKKPDG